VLDLVVNHTSDEHPWFRCGGRRTARRNGHRRLRLAGFGLGKVGEAVGSPYDK
jgi:hypothetical protein